jgi:hypothetical protein
MKRRDGAAAPVERQVGLDAADAVLVERAAHARERLLAVVAPGDELRDHRS